MGKLTTRREELKLRKAFEKMIILASLGMDWRNVRRLAMKNQHSD
jgi:hypothetical protein